MNNQSKERNPFVRALDLPVEVPANFLRILLKATLLFALSLTIAFNPKVQTIYISFLKNMYSGGLLKALFIAIIFSAVLMFIINLLITIVLKTGPVGQVLGSLAIASLQGFLVSYWVVLGSQFQLNGQNVAVLAIVLTVLIVFVTLILSNFMAFNAVFATKMLLAVVAVGIISFIIWFGSLLIPGGQTVLFNIFYLSPIAIPLSILMLVFLSYVLMGMFGFIRNGCRDKQIDRNAEWFCSVVINYLVVEIYQEVVKLLIKIAIRRDQ